MSRPKWVWGQLGSHKDKNRPTNLSTETAENEEREFSAQKPPNPKPPRPDNPKQRKSRSTNASDDAAACTNQVVSEPPDFPWINVAFGTY